MTTQPIRSKEDIKLIVRYFADHHEERNCTLFLFGIHTALRISDILALRWGDIYDFGNNRVFEEFTVIEKKTGKQKTIAVNKKLKLALIRLFKEVSPSPDRFIFAHPYRNCAISRIQAYRILRKAADSIGNQTPVSCHSLRKTLGYHLWRKGTSLAVIMDIYNHSSFDITRRYLGITQEDRNCAYNGVDYGL